MKKWILLAVLTGFCIGCADAQPTATAPGTESGEGIWLTDFAAASAKAKAENKHMLVDFSGSDWCGWCIKLDREVFSQPAFVQFAQERLVLVLLDFPRAKPQSEAVKAQNKKLMAQYQVQGFPTVLIIDPNGKRVETTGYRPGGAKAYVSYLKGILERSAAAH